MKTRFASAVAVCLALIQPALRAADVSGLLTSDDLKAYYSADFAVTPDPKPVDPVKGAGGRLMQFMYMSQAPSVRVATLLVRESDSPAAARKAAEAVRAEYGKMGIKVEDAPGIGDYAFFFGRQLVFAKGSDSFVVAAPGLTKERDPAECHAAVTALAKKIAERVR